MTRVNCIPVTELTDKHLLAEYRELPRVSRLVWKWRDRTGFLLNGKLAFVLPTPPNNYRLGAGHVKFFYDKGGYLKHRFEQLVAEMHRRGFKTTYTEYRAHPDGLNNDWVPDEKAIALNRARIAERLSKKTQPL